MLKENVSRKEKKRRIGKERRNRNRKEKTCYLK
jgi:hypothetical protein